MEIQSPLLEPVLHQPGDPALRDVLQLIRESFAYMEGRIDPPSSILEVTERDLSALCANSELWSIGSPPLACVCLTRLPQALNLGRLAVAQGHRNLGLGRRLVALAEDRARALCSPYIELKVRIELTENLNYYHHLGFDITAEGFHPGYSQSTHWIMRKAV